MSLSAVLLSASLASCITIQTSICFRITMDNLDVQEVFCGFYKTTLTTSKEQFKIVKDVLSRFQIPIDKVKASATMVLPMFLETLTDCVRS